ncbi:uncharacterized protein LOC142365299 [Opisthocomus hoazin]|uniref:uncharacterized protein LOC142365299 n=1 Tax=Opisthocomus hoazin TaxID=30419 RepID=UPI003F5373D5
MLFAGRWPPLGDGRAPSAPGPRGSFWASPDGDSCAGHTLCGCGKQRRGEERNDIRRGTAARRAAGLRLGQYGSPVRCATALTISLVRDERAAAGRLRQQAKKGHLEDTEEEETLHPQDHQRNYKDTNIIRHGWHEGDQEGGIPPAVSEDQVRDLLRNLNRQKSMAPDEMHPRVLRESAEGVAQPLSMIFEKSRPSGEAPGDWKKGSIVPIFQKDRKEDPGNYRPVSPTPVPGKVREQDLLEAVLRRMEDREVI